jgi:nucleoid-associated protein YgaU
VVRESRPTAPPRTAQSEPPPATARRDDRASAPRRSTRETEVEQAPQPAPEPEVAANAPQEPAPSEPSIAASPLADAVYTVKASDSLRSISLEHYGDAQYWPLILRANPDVNPLKLKAGDRLVLPAMDSAANSRTTAPRSAEKPAAAERGETPVYVTREGDTLPAISRRLYGDSRRWREIYDLNREQLETPSALRAGQRLKLPAPARPADESPSPSRP